LLSDLSNGPNRGNLYLCWSDERNGDVDVFVSSSSDGGDHWTEAVRVNNDEGHAHQFFPWMTVDVVTGNLYAVFYDRRNYTDYNTDVYLASSNDGGKTWTNERISEKPFESNAGVFLGDIDKKYFYPSHHLAHVITSQDVQRSVDFQVDDLQLLAYMRGEEIQVSIAEGWALVTVDGLSLGWGKVSQGRMKNHYPKGLRLKQSRV
jgi:NOL1/NOP2/fmu family ribosome biogenesis protein